jgi:Protein of unknown function (DUF2946)
MILGDLHRRHRFGAAIAIIAMAFYTVLLPWHTVSQATGPPRILGKSFEPPCHKVSATGDHGETPQPAKPRTNCPICNGFAAFHFAAPTLTSFVFDRAAVHAAILHGVEDGRVGVILRAPQSRGPPSSST